MPFLRRRELLAGIGLWTGAPLLGAFCRNMTEEALGQVPTRKRLVFYVQMGGMGEDLYYDRTNFTAGHLSKNFVPTGNADGSLNLGEGWAPLLPYKSEIN